MKDYLEAENARNRRHAALYEQLIKRAYGECQVMVGHHIGMEFAGDLQTENEIPSADTLLFDHPLMVACFGDHAVQMMQDLAAVPCEQREVLLERMMEDLRYGPKAA
jgi:hypothetical protein